MGAPGGRRRIGDRLTMADDRRRGDVGCAVVLGVDVLGVGVLGGSGLHVWAVSRAVVGGVVWQVVSLSVMGSGVAGARAVTLGWLGVSGSTGAG